jgi:prepilin-type N-terminal cleavage/methylation domain-containing protein
MKKKLSAFSFQVRGFTLIETMVAISVLILSLVSPLTIASNALKSAYYARDEITAFYLAQEGLEYVRAVRDENRLADASWLYDLDGSTGASRDCVHGACVIDFPNFAHLACSGACPALLISADGGLYNQVSGATSPYTRILTITQLSATEVKVTVTVIWMSGTINRSFSLSEHLFDWL